MSRSALYLYIYICVAEGGSGLIHYTYGGVVIDTFCKMLNLPVVAIFPLVITKLINYCMHVK